MTNVNIKKWDDRFLAVSTLIASWSKDRSRQVGCIIIGPDREPRTFGYNGFPRGIDDTKPERHQRPDKYLWTEHAERNAIFNAARSGIALKGSLIYLAWFPCAPCARAIIQSGITALVAGSKPDLNDPTYGQEFKIAIEMLQEAGVAMQIYDGEAPCQK